MLSFDDFNRILAMFFCIQVGFILLSGVLSGDWLWAIARYLIVGIFLYVALYFKQEPIPNGYKLVAWMPAIFSKRIMEWMWK